MNTRQLHYVLALAKEGSFSRAADVLNISQPSLSQYIKKIEKEQGVELFDRTGGDVRITDAGRVYIEAGREILDLKHQMEQKLEDLSAHRSGSIVVGVSPHRCIHLMPEIVKRFQNLYPGMHLVIEERFGASLLEDAEHGLFDLCIANLPVNEKLFSYKMIMKEEVLLAVNKETALYEKLQATVVHTEGRKYPAVDLTKLDGEKFVVLAENQAMQIVLDEACEKAGVKVKIAVECRTIETQFAMVRAGIGAAFIPSGIAYFSNAEKVAFFSFIQPVPYRDMAVVYRKEQYLSKAVENLIQLLLNLEK